METVPTSQNGRPGAGEPTWARVAPLAAAVLSAPVGWFATPWVEPWTLEWAMKCFAVFWLAMTLQVATSFAVLTWRPRPILLDLGWRPGARFIWILSLVAFLFVLSILRDFTGSGRTLWRALYWLPMGLWTGIRSLSRVQFVDSGVLLDWSLVPWRSIRTAAWVEGFPHLLKLKWGGWLGGSMEIKVPEEKREIVVKILGERVPNRGAS